MNQANSERKLTNIFERYLTVWVTLCIVGGILLGKVAPGVAKYLDGLSITVNGAPVVSIPIAIGLFFMMYPIMVKIDFTSVIKAGRSGKPGAIAALRPGEMVLDLGSGGGFDLGASEAVAQEGPRIHRGPDRVRRWCGARRRDAGDGQGCRD